jgi:D-alanyl-D-alanine dipeptidase
MRNPSFVAAALLLATAAATAEPPGFVDVATAAPSVRLDLRYATTDNFTHQVVYPAAQCLLRREVAERLRRVQAALEPRGLGLEVWDCYRPLSVQRRFWALVPDPRYVADPAKGSRHNRGAAVDLTLVDAAGRELDMGTGFDDFSPRSHRDARDLSAAARAHRATLEAAMAAQGFVGMPTEWWHFDAGDWKRYPIADVPLAAAPQAR